MGVAFLMTESATEQKEDTCGDGENAEEERDLSEVDKRRQS